MYEVKSNNRSTWQEIFSGNVSSQLGDVVEAVDRVARQIEVLSMFPEKYGSSSCMGLNVHSFYLKEGAAQLEMDFFIKASCLKSLRNHEAPQSVGLTTHEYERMIESRLLAIAPVVEGLIEADEKSTPPDAKLERNRSLLTEIRAIAEFFQAGADASPWIMFTDAMARQDEKSAEQALKDMITKKGLLPPSKAVNGIATTA